MPKRLKVTGLKPLPDGRYRLDIRTKDGKRPRKIFATKSLAEDALHKMKAAGTPAKEPARITFKELAEEWLAYRQGCVAELTYYSDVGRMGHVLADLGREPVGEIDGLKLVQFFTKLRKTRSGKTANRYRAMLSEVFKHAITTGRLVQSPIGAIKHYPEPMSSGRKRFLDYDEEEAIRKAMREHYPALEAEIDLAIYTGVRRNGLFRVKWCDVSFDRRIMTIRKKGGEPQEIFLVDEALAALRVLHAHSGGSEYVIPAAARAKRDWRRYFEKCVRIAGVENVRYHDLRHTFGTRAAMNGVPMVALQELLGHKSLTTTMRYSHFAQSAKPQMAELAVRKLQTKDTSLDTFGLEVVPRKEEVV